MAKDRCIADFLFEQGFNTVGSERAARETLMASGLTNSTKQNMSCDKLPRARKALASALFRACDDPKCQVMASLEAGTRRVVTVGMDGCEICGGKKAWRSLAWAAQRLGMLGISRVLVVGGTRAEHDEISRYACSRGWGRGCGVEFRFVDGTRPGRASEVADAFMSWAHLVVIWANTPLKHTVSNTYTAVRRERGGGPGGKPGAERGRVVYASHTGAAAMLDQIVAKVA